MPRAYNFVITGCQSGLGEVDHGLRIHYVAIIGGYRTGRNQEYPLLNCQCTFDTSHILSVGRCEKNQRSMSRNPDDSERSPSKNLHMNIYLHGYFQMITDVCDTLPIVWYLFSLGDLFSISQKSYSFLRGLLRHNG